MTNLSQVVQDERTARMVLSMIVEPDDAVTGRLLAELGALEVLRLAERDDSVTGLSAVDAQVWRAQPKWVVSRTLTSVGPNATLISGELEPAVRRLKAAHEGGWLVPGALVILEERADVAPQLIPVYEWLESRTFGDTKMHFYRYKPA